MTVTLDIKNAGENYIIPHLTAKMSVVDTFASVLFSEVRDVKNILPDTVVSFNSKWNTGLNVPGTYHVKTDIYLSDTLISNSSAMFEINPSLIISGDLGVAPPVVFIGGTVTADYIIRNAGNVSANGLVVKVSVVDPEGQNVVDTKQETIDLGIDSSKTGQFLLPTSTLGLKTYTINLQYANQGSQKNITNKSLTVKDGTSPLVSVISPAPDSYTDSAVSITAGVTDNASGIDMAEYQIDEGVWKLLPVSNPSQGIYSTTWTPTYADEGLHVIRLRAKDKSGNVSEPVSTAVRVEFIKLAGSVTVTPNRVYQGREGTLTYELMNNGNRDLQGVALKVFIVDPNTQQVKDTLSILVDIQKKDTVFGNFTFSTLTLSPMVYTVTSQAEVNSRVFTLSSASFEALPGLEIGKGISDITRILVWLNDGCEKGGGEEDNDEDDSKSEHTSNKKAEKDDDDDEDDAEEDEEKGNECIRQELIDKSLTEIGVLYTTVKDKKDFEREIRSNYHTDYLIFGDHNPLEDHYGEELRERVYSGRGLITAPWIGEDETEDIFGIKVDGKLKGRDNPVEFIESEIFPAQVFQSYGRAVKVKEYNEQDVLALLKDKDEKNYPGVLKNEYGLGKMLFYSFDLGLSAREENYSQLVEILKASLGYTHRPIDTAVFYPYDLIPVEIRLKSLGAAFDLKVAESYPDSIKLFDPSKGQWITENPWTKEIHLDANAVEVINLFALTSDKIGLYTLTTQVDYIENGSWKSYDSYSLEIKIEGDTPTLIADILYKLDTLYPSVDEEQKEVKEAKKYIEKVRDRIVNDSEDFKKNIHDTLEAIEAVMEITSVDTSDIRLDMDRLLGIWEWRWYAVGGDAK